MSEQLPTCVELTCISRLRTLYDLPTMYSSFNYSLMDKIEEEQSLKGNIWKVCCLIGLGLIVIMTILGNALICVVAALERRLRHRSNVFFISLAVTNVLYAGLVMTYNLVYNSLRIDYFKTPICLVFLSLDKMFSTASILHLVAIAFGRFIHIQSPLTFSRRFTEKTYLTVISSLWIVSVLIGFLPIQLGWQEMPHYNQNDNHHHRHLADSGSAARRCSVDTLCMHKVNTLYALANAALSFVLPLMLMVGIYSRLFLVTRYHVQNIKTQLSVGDFLASTTLPLQMGDSFYCGEAGETSARPSVDGKPRSSPSIRSIFYVDGTTPTVDPGAQEMELVNCSTLAAPTSRRKASLQRTRLSKDCLDILELNTSPAIGLQTRPCRRRMSLTGSLSKALRRSSLMTVLCVPSKDNLDAVDPNLRLRRDMSAPRVSLCPSLNRQQSSHQQLQHNSIVSVLSDNKAAVTLGVIVGSFLICWLPYFLMDAISASCNCIRSESEEFFFIATWLGYFNACLNPLVYSLLNSKFRRAYCSLLSKWRVCQNRRKQYGLETLRFFGETSVKMLFGKQFEKPASSGGESEKAAA